MIPPSEQKGSLLQIVRTEERLPRSLQQTVHMLLSNSADIVAELSQGPQLMQEKRDKAVSTLNQYTVLKRNLKRRPVREQVMARRLDKGLYGCC